MKKLLIIPDKDNLAASLSLAKEYNFGFEYNDFFTPEILDDEKMQSDIINKYKSCELPEFTTLHGAFIDILPFSKDKKIREASIDRINQSIHLAKELGVKAVVFHLNYNPSLNSPAYIDSFVKQNIEVWQSIIAENSDIDIYLENMFEKDPCILKRVALSLKKYSNFGICLDWAHASLSNAYPEDWAEALGEYIKHIHINDNNLIVDQHLAWGDGSVERDLFYHCYDKYFSDATVLIETKSIENQKKSIECLKADGVL